MFTILHISDLHRAPDDPVSNSQLVSALVADRDRYVREDPPIRAPDAILVSGDLVSGVRVGEDAGQIDEQYDAVYSFLDELTNRLLEGDRERVVVVPGNHDVDWNAAFSAMQIVGREQWPKKLSSVLSPGSSYRWVLDEQELYRIQDPVRYEERFDRYNRFVQRFYDGVEFPKHSEDPYVRLFELCDGRIVVAGFNSCYGNDCFERRGAIPPESIGRADLDIRDLGTPYELRMAVWHHHTDGPPHANDYMDVELVRQMIGLGFRVGLHGHQHRFAVAAQEIRLPGSETMALISAGSLCAGARDLPTGANRQYNLIELEDDLTSATVHVREVVSSMNFGARSHAQLGGDSFMKLSWQPPENPIGRIPDYETLRRNRAVLDAEEASKGGRPNTVVELLRPTANELDDYGRQLLLDAMYRSASWAEIIEVASPPRSISELTVLVQAHVRSEKYQKALDVLGEYASVVGMSEPDRNNLIERIRVEEQVHG